MPSSNPQTSLPPLDEQLRLVLDASPTGMMMVDERGCIVFVNTQTERIFGYARGELLGRSVDTLVPERYRTSHPAHRASFYDNLRARPMGAGRDLFGVRSDGTEVPIEIGLNPIRLGGETYVLSSIVDITERARAREALERQRAELERSNAELGQLVREREVLLKEIYHRVKNNLQIVSSLLSLQARQIEERSARRVFEEAQKRVQAIALVHEQLYGSKDFLQINLQAYLHTLIMRLQQLTDGTTATVRVVAPPMTVSIDTAIPCGLIVTELVTNAMKHAFPDSTEGHVVVEVVQEPTAWRLTVADDGVGIPEDRASRRPRSLGLDLVTKLARQIGGELRIERVGGTRCTVRVRDVS